MDKPAHTPGPWEWDAGIIPPDGPGHYSDIYVIDEDGEPIILAEFNDSIPEGRANAWLMTASPDLLKACEMLVRTMLRGCTSKEKHEALIAGRAAIAKALGQETTP